MAIGPMLAYFTGRLVRSCQEISWGRKTPQPHHTGGVEWGQLEAVPRWLDATLKRKRLGRRSEEIVSDSLAF
jgi:hypothetical protein